MACKKDKENREHTQLNKSEIELNRAQARKRAACQINNSDPNVYISLEISREQPSDASRNKVYKHIPVAVPENQGRAPKVTDDSDFGQSTLLATLNSVAILCLEAKSTSADALPTILCTTPALPLPLPQDLEDHFNFLSHIREREKLMRPHPFYVQQQSEIDECTRTLLINWLVSVVNELGFEPETLHLAVAHVDRFMSRVSVSRNKLLLMGITAAFVAAKYEETSAPNIYKFCVIGGFRFEVKDIVKMELLLLSTLSYDLHTPTRYTFTSAFALLANLPHLPSFLALYICELSLLETDPYLQFLPSQISAGSHALARYLLGYSIWSKELQAITLYRIEDLKSITMQLCDTHFRAHTFVFCSTKIKFMEEKYHQVAAILPLSMDEFPFDQIVKKYYSLDAN